MICFRRQRLSRNGLTMAEEDKKANQDEALLSVWRQALVERKKRVVVGDDSYPVQRTAKRKLAQVDFEFAGQRIRGLEQNPATASRWAELARKGAKVMQFLIGGRYIAAVSDDQITHFGKAIEGKRNRVRIPTKPTFRMEDGPNGLGSSRYPLMKACEDSLRRLGVETIDIYHMHGFDSLTPIEETLKTLDTLVQSGKVRYIACSNFSGWHLMKSLAISERYGWSRYIGHQVYYSLVGREYEWELMPLGLAEKVCARVRSRVCWGRVTGKIRRNQPLPEQSALHKTAEFGPQVPDELLYKVVDVLDEIAKETGKTIPQIALNWLLQRPIVANVIMGARDEKQLRDNLGAAGWSLSKDHVAKLDAVSDVTPIYPYWHQRSMPNRKPVETF